MPTPLAFTDSQIAAIMNAAQPLAPNDRVAFLEAVVEALDGKPIGDGAAFRAIRETQGRFLEPVRWGVRQRAGAVLADRQPEIVPDT